MISAVTRWRKSGGLGRDGQAQGDVTRDLRGHVDAVEVREGVVDRLVVLAHDGLAALAVGLFYRMLDGGDGFLAREHAADREEARLHHGVDAAAHARLRANLVAVDDVEAELLLDDVFLHDAREVIPHFVGPIGTVEQEGRAVHRILQDIVLFEHEELVYRNEVRAANQVRRADGLGPEAQV